MNWRMGKTSKTVKRNELHRLERNCAPDRADMDGLLYQPYSGLKKSEQQAIISYLEDYGMEK